MRLLQIGIILILSSCTLYPKYERPVVQTPESWRIDFNNCCESTDVLWWRYFNDPVLDDLVTQALENNQDLKIAIERVNEFIALLGIASSQLYPQISADIGAERQKLSTNATPLLPGTPQVSNLYNLVFNISYFVDFWGQVRSEVEAFYRDLQASIETRRTVILTLVSAVASTYITLRQFDKQLMISQETLESRKEEYRLAKIRFELGLTSEIQVEQAISEVEVAQVAVDNYKISIAQTENLMSVILGQPSMAIARGLSLDKITLPPKIPSYLPSEIVNQRPDILAAEQKLMANNARIGIAKAQFFPQITLTGAYGAESTLLNNFLQNPSRIWDYGVTIFQEIFTGGRLTSGVRLREAQMRESLHEYIATILKAFKEVNDALVEHKINLEIQESQKVRLIALKQYLHLADLRYKEGETDYLTFLDAERQTFRAELDYVDAEGKSFLSLINLYKALGGGWVEEIDSR